jgi:triosephosphate isomerase (TIM)
MRKKMIAGNWKMYKITNEAVDLVNRLKRGLVNTEDVDIVVCPPFTALTSVYDVIMESNILLGAQDMYWEKEGAFTGEISPVMLKDCGCEFVIIGHSERRKFFNETDSVVNKKTRSALSFGLTPIVCCGETLEEREAGKTNEVLKRQLDGGFNDMSAEDMKSLVIAYEPVWAIGTGKTATPAIAQEAHKFIREWIKAAFSQEVADALRILYGGSVKPENAKELIFQEDIDGALVGGASLTAESFVGIVKNSL